MFDTSQGLRALAVAAVLLVAGCQSPAPAPDTSAYQKAEAAKLNAELSQEVERKREREKAAR